MLRKYRKEEKLEHCKRWKASGLKRSDYCRREGLTRGSLWRWLKVEDNRDPRLVEIKVASVLAKAETEEVKEKAKRGFEIEVRFPNGIGISFLSQMGCQQIEEIFKVIHSCS